MSRYILKGIGTTDVAQILKQAGDGDITTLMQKNFAFWAQFSGIKVDGHAFSFDDHRYLLPIYKDQGRVIVWQKAAQLGATIYMLLRLLWMCRHINMKAGLYFPTADGVEALAKDRLNPLLRSNKDLYDNLNTAVNTLGLKQINNIEKEISSLYMLYVGGTASKDSVPLDALAFDEVRLIDPGQIDQCMERIAHSSLKYEIYMSTAGLPNTDINARFLRGSQHVWMVNCGSPFTCPDGFDPSMTFPDCIVDTGEEVYLRCPKCKKRIYDPQYGRYIAQNPSADFNSYRVSQLTSKFITPKIIYEFFQTTTNIQEFYNAKLSLPYVDEDNRPVNDLVLDAATNKDLKWAYQVQTNKAELVRYGTAMGIDQGSGYCYVVIAKRTRGGKKQIVHVELIEQANPGYWKRDEETGIPGPVSPFVRCCELMEEFNVRMCIIDAMPNANEAANMARHFKGKAFVSWYKDLGVDMVLWGDRPVDKQTIRKGNEDIKLNANVTISRYLSLDYMLKQWVDGVYIMPDARMVKQVARNQSSGRFEAEPIGMRFRAHLKSLVRKTTVTDAETGKSKTEWIHVGEDHFAHAMNYCNIAIERMRSTSPFSFA